MKRSKPKKPWGLSPSSASTYNQCPKRWKFRYVDKLPDPPGESALIGTFSHLVLEHLMQEEPAERSQERAKVLARELWPEFETEKDYVALGLDEEQARAFRWKSWEAIAGLWRLEDPSITEVKETEQKVSVKIGEVPFLGIVDRVDLTAKGTVVTDYKSGKAPSPRFESRPLKQVMLYAVALRELSGETPVAARLHYLGQRTVGTEVTEAKMGQACEELFQTWSDLNTDFASDNFEPKTGPLCAWCPYVNHCRVGTEKVHELIQIGKVRPDAPALEILGLNKAGGPST